ncbi:MAG: hypothetical protein H3C33_07120 [Rhodocyclaceae bacterium]|nr:hypothetical protein [Rhodocyclaceae bacterium]
MLQLFDPELGRIGTELRSPEGSGGGWAIRVSTVCDGLGPAVTLLAALAALRKGWRRLAAGIAAIQLFNLLRILALALALALAPQWFDTVHAGVFPLLGIAVLALCALPSGTAWRLVLVSLPLVALWLAFSDPVVAVFVDLVNPMLAALPFAELGELALRPDGWRLGSYLLASAEGEPVRLFVAPFSPGDYVLGAPVVLAAVVLARRPWWLAGALLLMLLALVLAVLATVWSLGGASPSGVVLIANGSGVYLAQDYIPPTELAQRLVRLAQDVLVHFNLLVLPLLIAARGPETDTE